MNTTINIPFEIHHDKLCKVSAMQENISEGSDYRIVGEIPFNYQFVSDSQEVAPLNEEYGTDYDSFFVRIGEGEYTAVYGMEGIMATLSKRVYRVRG